MKSQSVRVAVLLLVLVAVAAASLLAPSLIEASPRHEYQFVRLVDDGAMPVISEALNRQAEQGWELAQMTVVAGQPGAIYLVFER